MSVINYDYLLLHVSMITIMITFMNIIDIMKSIKTLIIITNVIQNQMKLVIKIQSLYKQLDTK